MTRIPAGYEMTHALCHAAYAWHSGQGSRVYRIACRLNRRLVREGMERPLDTKPTMVRYQREWDRVFRIGVASTFERLALDLEDRARAIRNPEATR